MNRKEEEARISAYNAMSWYLKGLRDGYKMTFGKDVVDFDDALWRINSALGSIEMPIYDAKKEEE